jgi:hypothetical protein
MSINTTGTRRSVSASFPGGEAYRRNLILPASGQQMLSGLISPKDGAKGTFLR